MASLARLGLGGKVHDGDDRHLVLLELAGGNDGLSTLVPHGDDAYLAARSATRIDPKTLLRLDDYRGLHPAATSLRDLWDRGELAIVEGVGYPSPHRSHFLAREVWGTGSEHGRAAGDGWLGKLLAHIDPRQSAPAVHFGDHLPEALRSTPGDRAWLRPDPQADLQGTSTRPAPGVAYPDCQVGATLRATAALLRSAAPPRVVSLTVPGFDTHADQREAHDRLWLAVDRSIGAFLRDLRGTSLGPRTLLMVFSEFGRSLAENPGRGTDHGSAAPVFLCGEPVRGGLFGKHPSLSGLAGCDLMHTTDFRQVYATLLQHWFGVDSALVLPGGWPRLPFLAAC